MKKEISLALRIEVCEDKERITSESEGPEWWCMADIPIGSIW